MNIPQPLECPEECPLIATAFILKIKIAMLMKCYRYPRIVFASPRLVHHSALIEVKRKQDEFYNM